MPRAHYTAQANQDLIEIGLYIAQDSLAAALRWTEAISPLKNALLGIFQPRQVRS